MPERHPCPRRSIDWLENKIHKKTLSLFLRAKAVKICPVPFHLSVHLVLESM